MNPQNIANALKRKIKQLDSQSGLWKLHEETLSTQYGVSAVVARNAKLFSLDESESKKILGFNGSGGIVCPYCDEAGELTSARFRPDNREPKYWQPSGTELPLYSLAQDVSRVFHSNEPLRARTRAFPASFSG